MIAKTSRPVRVLWQRRRYSDLARRRIDVLLTPEKNHMTYEEQMKIVNSLSDKEVKEYARLIVARGATDYPPDTFTETFGLKAAALAGAGYSNRLAPVLKSIGFAISLKLFPGNREGCAVHSI